MSAQLVGVLREVVAATSGAPAPGTSTRFTPPATAGRRALPTRRRCRRPSSIPTTRRPASSWPSARSGPDELVDQLGGRGGLEVDLWLVRALIDARRFDEASTRLADIERAHPREWRTAWYRGVNALAAGDAQAAEAHLRRVYRALPGELAPKLALGMAAEQDGDADVAASWYDVVSRTDPSYTSASFGLARCRIVAGDPSGAVDAYERVPATSSAHVDAQVAETRLLVDGGLPDRVGSLRRAARIVEHLPLDRARSGVGSPPRYWTRHWRAVRDGAAPADPTATVFGCRLDEHEVRLALEAAYRDLGRHATTRTERISVVERANQVRPRSLL